MTDLPTPGFDRATVIPGSTLRQMMDALYIDVPRTAWLSGIRASDIRGIFAGRVPITSAIACKLAVAVGPSEDFWLERERQYLSAVAGSPQPLPPQQTPESVQQDLIEDWNRRYPVGTAVVRYALTSPLREPECAVTASAAWLSESKVAVVKLVGKPGYHRLQAVVPMTRKWGMTCELQL